MAIVLPSLSIILKEELNNLIQCLLYCNIALSCKDMLKNVSCILHEVKIIN